jgi:hypothetical protein
MSSVSPSIPIVNEETSSISQFFNGYFHYQKTRYRIIDIKENLVQEETMQNAHVLLKVATIFTGVIPLIALCFYIKNWIWSGAYRILPADGEKEKKVEKASGIIPNQKKPGVAPNREAAEKFLKHPSIAPGSAVDYCSKNGEIKTLSLGLLEEMHLKKGQLYDRDRERVYINDQSFITVERDKRLGFQSEKVKYLEEGELIEGKSWESYLPYRHAINAICMENPPAGCYIEALRNGKVVKVYIESKQDNEFTFFNVIKYYPNETGSSEEPKMHYYPYSFTIYKTVEKSLPYYSGGRLKILTNTAAAIEMLRYQKPEHYGQYLQVEQPTGEMGAALFYWREIIPEGKPDAEKCVIGWTKENPDENDEPYDFSDEELIRALTAAKFTVYE